MNKHSVLFLIVLIPAMSGCALTMKDVPLLNPPAQETGPGAGISLGMARDQVTAVMNKLVTVGFEVEPATGVVKPIQINSLYSSEMLTLGGQAYQVDYYIVDALKAQVQIADTDLFPVVFLDNVLAAKGRAGLEALGQKQQGQ